VKSKRTLANLDPTGAYTKNPINFSGLITGGMNMPIDTRLIGFWNHASVTDGTCFEITPAGKYFVHENPFPYEISKEGTKLILHGKDEDVVYHRVGHPTTTIAGAWSHVYSEYGETETFIFNEDGSYINSWDGTDYSIGFFQDTGSELRIIEYRGSVATDGDKYRYTAAPNDVYEYRFEFSETDSFNLYDIDSGQLESTYNRKTS